MDPFAVKQACRESFFSTPGIVGLGIGDYKPGCNCLIAYVEHSRVRIPPLDFPVVPYVTGKLDHFSLLSAYQTRYRPYPAGVSIGTHSRLLNSNISGTLGMMVPDRNGEAALLGNNHIFTGIDTFENPTAEGGQFIWQPGSYYGGSELDSIARLSSWAPIYEQEPNLVDCALATPFDQSEVSRTILEIGQPDAIAEPFRGMAVEKVGMASGHTTGYVIDVDATMRISFGPVTATFENQTVIANDRFQFAEPGDSGSAVLSKVGNSLLAVGLLSGGSESVVVANKMKTVQDALGFFYPYYNTSRPAYYYFLGVGAFLARMFISKV